MNLYHMAATAILSCTALLGTTLAGAEPAGEAWPSRPITIIAPYGAGGTTDLVARLIAKSISEATKQPVVVENKGGVGGVLGTSAFVRLKNNGYTFLVSNLAPQVIAAIMRNKPPYDPIKDFAPIAMVSEADEFLAVNAKLPVHSVKELIAYARAHPGQLNYGSPGIGSFGHFASELFAMQAGISIQHIPYDSKGSMGALNDFMSGNLQILIDPAVVPVRNDPRVRLLATSNTERFPGTPDVPTLRQSGLPDYVVTGWFGLFGAPGTPQAVIEKLTGIIHKASASPQWQRYLLGLGLTPLYLGPDQFSKRLRADLDKFRAIKAQAHIPYLD
ncbi:Bug family tripartite tricarboxylate transporter substrate binding protein [Candidimonas nitroreducens]|uniref:ABC transporter substrate-binding protein n=1 Tax=Candidimonas nitroreducens TaxID=683354 RepID=A0A225M8E4_9BURK|nr:tripartite tricarboxylate transporter substrate binding protein [Candidimonas nitroreducens]OWT57386.1 ABC transporter substrate-binding protein [Candidimonas nitroreducens]